MRDVRIPSPNPALAQILLDQPMRSLVRERGEIAQALYREVVAKRTRALARSARVYTFRGGRHSDRWYARLIVGEELDYGASHEFGTDDGDERITPAAHDLRTVLAGLDGL